MKTRSLRFPFLLRSSLLVLGLAVFSGLHYGFLGWQTQSEARTVQACIEEALSRVADHGIGVVCVGRTDTDVHALFQVIHLRISE